MTRAMERANSEVHYFFHWAIVASATESTDSEIHPFSLWAIITHSTERTMRSTQSLTLLLRSMWCALPDDNTGIQIESWAWTTLDPRPGALGQHFPNCMNNDMIKWGWCVNRARRGINSLITRSVRLKLAETWGRIEIIDSESLTS